MVATLRLLKDLLFIWDLQTGHHDGQVSLIACRQGGQAQNGLCGRGEILLQGN